MPRGRADIANSALRIFLQEMGGIYDDERGLPRFRKQNSVDIAEFFGNRCCYCGTDFEEAGRVTQDHLVPMNKEALGLHAWGNVVPACPPCNSKKQGRDWREFIIERAGAEAPERHAKVKAFVAEYAYAPSLQFRDTAAQLYEEVGAVAMSLISSKISWTRGQM